MTSLSVRQLRFRYPGAGNWLFGPLDFDLQPGEILGVGGANGCGKSTLLYLLCGVIPQIIVGERSGTVLLDDCDVANIPLNQLGTRINLLMQNLTPQFLFPEVEQEITFALENDCLPAAEIHSRAEHALSHFSLESLRHACPAQLSGGERQRVALAALYAQQPDILLLDEPFTGLSSRGRGQVEDLLREWQNTGRSVLVTGHRDEDFPDCDRILELHGGMVL